MTTTRIFLARHGETVWNQAQKFQGNLDSPLTPLGVEQAAQVAQNLTEQNINLIVSSNLGRAIKSAEICQQYLSAELLVEPLLNERDLGIWQGQHIADLTSDADYHEALHQLTEFAPPQGESAKVCALRIEQALINIAKNNLGKNIVVICHGEAKRCLFALLGQNQQGNAYQLYQNGAISPLVYHNDKGCLQFNDDAAVLDSSLHSSQKASPLTNDTHTKSS